MDICTPSLSKSSKLIVDWTIEATMYYGYEDEPFRPKFTNSKAFRLMDYAQKVALIAACRLVFQSAMLQFRTENEYQRSEADKVSRAIALEGDAMFAFQVPNGRPGVE